VPLALNSLYSLITHDELVDVSSDEEDPRKASLHPVIKDYDVRTNPPVIEEDEGESDTDEIPDTIIPKADLPKEEESDIITNES